MVDATGMWQVLYAWWQMFQNIKFPPDTEQDFEKIMKKVSHASVKIMLIKTANRQTHDWHVWKAQVKDGANFIHEHPHGASSWQLGMVARILRMPGMRWIRNDQCAAGATSSEGKPIR